MKCRQRSSDDKLKMCAVEMIGKSNCEKTEEGLYINYICASTKGKLCCISVELSWKDYKK